MAGYDRHTRVVGWLKVALPLLALVILSTLFLVSRTIDPMDAIPYAEVDVADRIREPRMTAPAYSGVTSDGAAVSLTASEARPADDATGASAKAIRADMATPDGATTQFRAETADLDATAHRLTLGGGVQIETSTGYKVQAEALTLALDRTGAQSQGAVQAEGPPGAITAGAMEIRQDPAAPGSYVLLFNNRVTLIYQP